MDRKTWILSDTRSSSTSDGRTIISLEEHTNRIRSNFNSNVMLPYETLSLASSRAQIAKIERELSHCLTKESHTNKKWKQTVV